MLWFRKVPLLLSDTVSNRAGWTAACPQYSRYCYLPHLTVTFRSNDGRSVSFRSSLSIILWIRVQVIWGRLSGRIVFLYSGNDGALQWDGGGRLCY